VASSPATPESARIPPSGWTPFIRLYVVAATFALTLAFWSALGRIITLMIIGTFATIALDAGIRTLQRQGLSRRIASFIVLGSGVGVFLAGALFGIPAAIRQLDALLRATPRIVRDVTSSDLWESIQEHSGASDNLARAAQTFVESAPSLVGSVVSSTVGTVFNLLMVALAVLFLLSSGSRPLTLLVRIVPGIVDDRAWDVVAEIYESIGRYVIGAIVQATIAGVTIAGMLMIVDVPYAIALGIITFFWDFIPMIGSTIAAIPCVAVALASQGVGTAVFVGIFIIVFTQVENGILQPRIQGGAAKLPGAAIFFSVLVGGTLFGIPGAILAVPAASVVATILTHWFEHRGVATLQPPRLFDSTGSIIRNRVPETDT
jgi:predicted PurR-regulated permease PerM